MIEESVMEGEIGETATDVGNLEVSVSFRRFDNDLLSWERWSSFSQNKYLEEVEKCSTPGSVAEKKAYLEARYKRIAAKKADIEDQQKQFETTLSMAAKNNGRGTITNYEESDELKQKETNSLVDDIPTGVSPASKKSDIMDKYKQLELDLNPGNNGQAYPIQSTQSVSQAGEIQLVKGVNNLNNELGGEIAVRKPNECDNNTVFQTTITVGEKQESNFKSESGDGLVKVEHDSVEHSPWAVKARTEANFDTGEILKSSTEERTKLKTQKISKVRTERSVTNIKKAPVLATPKSPLISSSTLKRMKPSSTPSKMSTSCSMAVEGIMSSESSIKSSNAELKKPAPKTDMISRSPGMVRYAPVPATPKPSFMEKMKDKDIVKHASKTFQCKPDPIMSSGEQSDSLPKQML